MKMYEFKVTSETVSVNGVMPAVSNQEVLRIVRELIPEGELGAKITVRLSK